jgi:hypothetical protein
MLWERAQNRPQKSAEEKTESFRATVLLVATSNLRINAHLQSPPVVYFNL